MTINLNLIDAPTLKTPKMPPSLICTKEDIPKDINKALLIAKNLKKNEIDSDENISELMNPGCGIYNKIGMDT